MEVHHFINSGHLKNRGKLSSTIIGWNNKLHKENVKNKNKRSAIMDNLNQEQLLTDGSRMEIFKK